MSAKASPPPKTSLLRFLGWQMQPYARWLVLGFVLNTMHGVAITFQNLAPKYLIDDIVTPVMPAGERWMKLAQLMGFYLLASIVFRMVFWHLSFRIFTWVRERILLRLRARFYRHINSLCLRFHGRHNSGELFSYLFGSPLTQLQQFMHQTALMGPGMLALLVSSLGTLLMWDFVMTAVLAASVFTSVWLMNQARHKIHGYHTAFQSSESEVSGRVADLIRGTREIKLYAAEGTVGRDFKEQAAHISKKSVWRDVQSHIEWMKQEGAGYVFFALVCSVGAWRCLDGHITQGELVGYLLSYGGLQGPLQQLYQLSTLYGSAEASFARMNAVLQTPSTTPDPPPGSAVVMPHRGEVAFEGVHFKYAAKDILNGLSFRIPYGQKVAFVGPSGAGKTTISQLMIRLYDPSVGRITVDGVDLSRCRGADVRKSFGVVPQSPYFFQTTIRQNLLLIRPDADDDQLRRACEMANAWEFIAQLPEGLDARVGEAGANLSGGQRQRLAIARVLLMDPPFLIFDEATSALDTVSERLIQESLEKNLQGKTAVFIAHRLATIKACDRIMVLEQGRLVQDGSYAELSNSPGLFRDMIEADRFGVSSVIHSS
ncbi:MAG: ABC transporter ATP-binding protein [Candidatus Methylacidiphilales bacterium]|nr:ABC transporter ATP-binding protein [Candidatus Methylacidiphilales bacterium]